MTEREIDNLLVIILMVAIMIVVIGVIEIKLEHKTNSIDTNVLETRLEILENRQKYEYGKSNRTW